MAKKEKIVVDVASNFEVKLTDGKSKTKADKLVIESPFVKVANTNFNPERPETKNNPEMISVLVVDKCIEISQHIESLKSELSFYEIQVLETAKTEKEKAANDDTFVKTIDITGSSKKIQVQFRDSFSKMDVSMEAPLKKIFNDKYDIMFTKIINYTLREEKLKSLKTLLGDQFDFYFKTDEAIKPAENFQQTFFNLRKSFKEDQKEVIEKVKIATQSKPAIKYS